MQKKNNNKNFKNQVFYITLNKYFMKKCIFHKIIFLVYLNIFFLIINLKIFYFIKKDKLF